MDLVTAARKKGEAEKQIKAIIKTFQDETGLLVTDVKMDWIGVSSFDSSLIDSFLCIELKVSFGS